MKKSASAAASAAKDDSAAAPDGGDFLIAVQKPVVQRLEEELRRVKAQLRSSVKQLEIQTEELRASNRVLQALNEEQSSAAAELETSRERLQSVNEELVTVNRELKIKIEELSQSNDDFQNLMNSTDIGTIFLDRRLRVKLFTPIASEVFDLTEADLNRPLADITTKLVFNDVLADVEAVLDTLQTAEREVETQKGRWYLMRIFPYRASEDRINGAVITFVDITARREAEKSIRFQARLLNTVEQSVIAADLDGTVIYWNQFAEKLYGWTAKEATGRSIMELTTPQVSAEQAAEMMTRRRRRESWTGEFRARRRDGTTFPAEVCNSPIEDYAGQVIGVVGVSIDLTKRKQAEGQLNEASEQLERQMRIFDTTLSAIADFAYIFDRDGRFLYANQALLDLLGLTAAEITGKNFFELPYPKDLAETLDRQIRQVFETKKMLVDETFYTSPTGVSGFYEYIFSPVFNADGAVEVVAGSTRETTQRRRGEEALRESEERLRLLIESTIDYAIFTTNEDGLINSWNAGAERIFGFAESEILGESGAILFTPEDRAANIPEQEFQIAAATGRAEDERWHIRKDGSRFYASGMMMRLKDGGAGGFAKIARDMTDKKKIEKGLRDRETLQKIVGAQEDERKRIARDLHDHLGQQLTALKFKLEVIRKMSEEKEICGKIDETQLIAKHIDDTVDFLAWELRPAALDDLGLLAALENYTKEWSRQAGIAAEFYTAGMKKTRLSPESETNLYRIGQEALNNVFKHAKAKSANIILERRGESVILIVEDDGIGFDVEDKNNRGKGIGLVGMRERAALIGGTLDIESAREQGTTIFARVPVKPD